MLTIVVSHVVARFGMGDGVDCVGECPFVFYFAGRSYEGAQGGAGEGASDADSPDSGCCQLFDGERCALQAHQDVDWLGDRAADLSDGFEAGESGRVEDIGACFGEGLQPTYGVVEIGATVEEVFGPCGQEEMMGLGRLCGRFDSFHCELEVVDGVGGVAGCVFD